MSRRASRAPHSPHSFARGTSVALTHGCVSWFPSVPAVCAEDAALRWYQESRHSLFRVGRWDGLDCEDTVAARGEPLEVGNET